MRNQKPEARDHEPGLPVSGSWLPDFRPFDDPRVNFAISSRARPGVDHLGIQAESDAELAEIVGRLQAADGAVFEQRDAACCYARSDKGWARDPQGVVWETFFTHGAHGDYGEDTDLAGLDAPAPARAGGACCGPAA